MASSSSSNLYLCYNCSSLTPTFKQGWQLTWGGFAQLCDNCGAAYEEGRFCETFHLTYSGWRDCVYCRRMLHCGCIVSAKNIIELDEGGVSCISCDAKITRKISRATREDIHPRAESNSNSEDQIRVIPLFEKVITFSDADRKNARLVLPKKCAEFFFPVLTQPQGVPITVEDTTGRNWQLHYRFWSNANSRMYVLEGLKHYMISSQWQPGDSVTFSRIEPSGKLLIGTRKAPENLPQASEDFSSEIRR